jgi:hypothetical protein
MIFVMVFQEQINLLNMSFFHDLIVEFALYFKILFRLLQNEISLFDKLEG